jgi:hypothetical protein
MCTERAFPARALDDMALKKCVVSRILGLLPTNEIRSGVAKAQEPAVDKPPNEC